MNFLKKQGVAWVITAVMILLAIGIGSSKTDSPSPRPDDTPPPVSQDAYYFVCDDADILTDREERELGELNRRLESSMGVVVACVTTTDGRSSIVKTAQEYASRMGARECDFIIVVDMRTEQYLLLQGSGLEHLFTEADCEDYADYYMLDLLVDGRYGDAFLSLADALADWYEDHYVA